MAKILRFPASQGPKTPAERVKLNKFAVPLTREEESANKMLRSMRDTFTKKELDAIRKELDQ